jgi:hypothetical protein
MRYLLIILCSCLASCSKRGDYGDHPPYPTSGKIVINGQPADNALVIFRHIEDWGDRSILPQAWTDKDGRFALSTYGVNDGAPVGDYQVLIQWPAYHNGRYIGDDKLGGKFADKDKAYLRAHVDKGKNEIPPFEIDAILFKVSDKPVSRQGRKR